MSTLFVTDLDGTLLGADARISQESAALLHPMLDEGLQLAVATARAPPRWWSCCGRWAFARPLC